MVPYELLACVVAIFERLGIPYLVTGSVAAMAYGEPRLTNDVDIVAAIGRETSWPPSVGSTSRRLWRPFPRRTAASAPQ